jgi:hypothetical protein
LDRVVEIIIINMMEEREEEEAHGTAEKTDDYG